MRALALLSFPFTLALATAQLPNVQSYGASCSFLNQPLTIGVQGLPRIGTTFTLTYSGPNLNGQLIVQPALAFGFGAITLPIPAASLPQQPVGCTAWVVPEVVSLMPLTPTGVFADRIDLAVPNEPRLIGLICTAQWLAVVMQCGILPGCTFEALPTSDAVLLTVGM